MAPKRLPVFICACLAASAPLFAAGDCDRACLKTALDRYLGAVIKHDPSAAPLAVGFRQTDNAVAIRLGTGVWKTVTALGKLQRHYLDPVSEQAGYFGIVQEGENAAIVTVRIKVDQRKISEAEWFIVHKGDPGLNGPAAPGRPAGNFFYPDNLAANAPPERTVPKEARLSREDLITITNSYFDGITSHDGSVIQAYPGCMRVENGNTVTGRSGRGKSGAASDCTSGLENINIQNVAARRYPIADEDAGTVLALGVFIRKPGTMTRRNAFSEWFVIDGTKIRSVYSAMFYPAPEAPVPNWPPYDGNWPLPPAFFAPPAGK
jgi:hypothetical protein